MASITCKIRFGDEVRRFTTTKDHLTFSAIHKRVKDLFDFGDQKFRLQYTDDEQDLITMSTDEEMTEAVTLASSAAPPILRITVKMNDKTKEEAKDSKKAASTPAAEAAPAATEPTPDLSSLMADISGQLPALFGNFACKTDTTQGAAAAPPDLTSLGKTIGDALPAFVASLPDAVKAQMGNAELDVAATAAANSAATIAAALSGKAPKVSFGFDGSPARGYGDPGVHPGVTCDKTGQCPIVGPRYNLKGHNYDLCEAEFLKLDAAEQAKFVKIDPPFNCGWKPPLGVHPGVTCDKTGQSPIVGPRYNLKGHNYDLCEAEFLKLDAAEQAKFVKIDPPCVPWRPKCWRGGMGGPGGWHGHGGGHGGMGCHGPNPMHGKLGARFVSDVSIFDGTQMAPGTQFTKIWRIKNIGEMAWPPGAKLLFVGGDQMSAELTVPIGDPDKMVMPGEEVDVAVDMVAPAQLGRYLGYWRLTGPHGRRRFGQRVWCHIQVVDPAGAETVHDEKTIADEISTLMAKAAKSCPEDKDDADADVDSAARGAEPGPAESASPAGVQEFVESVVECASNCSSVASSAVSVRKEEVAASLEQPEKEAPAAVDETAAVGGKAPAAELTEEVATQLTDMGFEKKSVALIVEKNAEQEPPERLLESCTRDLVQLSEWDEMLSDLEEMGFADRELNTRLMVKNNGSVKRTVKDLVHDGA